VILCMGSDLCEIQRLRQIPLLLLKHAHVITSGVRLGDIKYPAKKNISHAALEPTPLF
jgi:hypothetical protein